MKPNVKTKGNSLFLIKNQDTGEYLYHAKRLYVFQGDYHFKHGKAGAVMLDKQKAKKVIIYLRKEGFNVCRKKV